MSRDIRFRAWDKEKKVMFIIFDSTNQTEWYLPHWKDNFEVTQYTGLKDKKRTEQYPEGQEIYEGDIVSCKMAVDPQKEAYRGEVVYKINYDGPGFEVKTKKGNYLFAYKTEVIGNIYENPELLEEGKSC